MRVSPLLYFFGSFVLVIALGLLAGCGTPRVYDDHQRAVNLARCGEVVCDPEWLVMQGKNPNGRF